MYAVRDMLPVTQLDPGAFLLVGPAMSGKYDLMLDLLVAGFEDGDSGLFVTTNDDARSFFEDVEERTGSIPERLRIVDCVSERQGAGDRYPEDRVEYVSSPADLTGIGIGVSEQLRRFAETPVDRVRVGFYSLSTMLMYTEIETVFRFVHVLTGRLDSMDALGLFAIDPTTHEDDDLNTLKQLFDGMIEVRETGVGNEARVVGVPETTAEWTPIP